MPEPPRTATRTLSEPDSKALLAGFGVPIAPERVVDDADGAAAAATEIGFPVVVKLAGDATVLLASTRRRSQESMRILAPGREFTEHAELIEAPLPPPPFPNWLHLSPKKWGFLARFWWWFFDHHCGEETRAQAHVRADAAAEKLIALAQQGHAVVVVAHGFFNVMIEKSLVARGWTRVWRRGGFRYWSARHFQKL